MGTIASSPEHIHVAWSLYFMALDTSDCFSFDVDVMEDPPITRSLVLFSVFLLASSTKKVVC